MQRTSASRLSALWLAGVAVLGCGEDAASGCNTPGILCTVAGSGDLGHAGDDGPALQARLAFPQDTLTASDGTLYPLDWNNHRIRKVVDGTIHHVAGNGDVGGSLDDPATSDFNHPTGMLFSADETRLLVAAWHNNKIRTLDLGTLEIVEKSQVTK